MNRKFSEDERMRPSCLKSMVCIGHCMSCGMADSIKEQGEVGRRPVKDPV